MVITYPEVEQIRGKPDDVNRITERVLHAYNALISAAVHAPSPNSYRAVRDYECRVDAVLKEAGWCMRRENLHDVYNRTKSMERRYEDHLAEGIFGPVNQPVAVEEETQVGRLLKVLRHPVFGALDHLIIVGLHDDDRTVPLVERRNIRSPDYIDGRRAADRQPAYS